MTDHRLLHRSLSVASAAKPGACAPKADAMPDGSSENFRFVPVPIESRSSENAPADAARSLPAGTSAFADDGLSPQQRLAIGTLLCGGTLASCAARVGVSVRTLYKWRHEPNFAFQFNRRSAEALEASCVRARNLLLKSTQVVNEMLYGRGREDWALRVIKTNKIWEMAHHLPALPVLQEPMSPEDLSKIDVAKLEPT